MLFLGKEVEHENQRTLVQSGFNGASTKDKKKFQKFSSPEEFLTAAGLYAGHVTCFCEKLHDSDKCIKAQSLSLAEKNQEYSQRGPVPLVLSQDMEQPNLRQLSDVSCVPRSLG